MIIHNVTMFFIMCIIIIQLNKIMYTIIIQWIKCMYRIIRIPRIKIMNIIIIQTQVEAEIESYHDYSSNFRNFSET